MASSRRFFWPAFQRSPRMWLQLDRLTMTKNQWRSLPFVGPPVQWFLMANSSATSTADLEHKPTHAGPPGAP